MRPNNKHHNTVIVNSAEKPNSKLENFLHMKVRKSFIKERLTSNSLYFFIYFILHRLDVIEFENAS